MPQETNLNIYPYHDDFDSNKNFHRILFKPGTPVQARELTGLQSILQDQIEKFGTHFFKEGAKIIPGQLSYNDVFAGIVVDSSYLGVPISLYASQLLGKTIKGQNSEVEARVEYVLSDVDSERSLYTLYLSVLKSGSDFSAGSFEDGETLVLLETLTYGNTTISANQGFANAVSVECNIQGSAANIQSGVYFLRGNFVSISPQTILLSQYSSMPTVKVGLTVQEEIINSIEDPSLNDNAQGFSNYSAPGADRLKITAVLTSKLIIDNDDPSFVELMRIQNGEIETFVENTEYNYIKAEFARRTYDESGDYYIKPFDISVKNTLNNYLGNDGIYNSGDVTYQGNTPSDSLMEYIMSSGKAYVRGFEINKQTDTVIDVEKPRTTRQIFGQAVPISIGPAITINNVHGSPVVGFGTTIAATLRDQRVGVASTSPAGDAIGECRIYDYNLESQVFSGPQSEYTLRIFDISPYTKLQVTQPFTSLRSGAFIQGKYSGASGFVVEDASGISTFSLRQVKGTFNRGEKLVVDGIDYNTTVAITSNYDISNVKSIHQGTTIGISTFNADLKLTTKSRFATPFTISAISGVPGVSTITAPQGTFVGIITANDLVRFTSSGVTNPVVLKVQSIGSDGDSITLAGIQTVSNVLDGAPPSTSQVITNLEVVSGNLIKLENNKLYTKLDQNNIDSVDLGSSDIFIKKTYNNITSAANGLSLPTAADNEYYLSFDEERYHVAYSDGTIEPLTSDKVQVSSNRKNVSIVGLARAAETNIRVSAVLNKNKVTQKQKKLRNTSSIIVSRSSNPASGIGSTTTNDGLTYSNVYGTRVQDEEISLNKPDVLRVLAIYESDDQNDPDLPKIILSNISGPNQSTADFIIGEKITGQSSKAVARVVSSVSTTQIEIVYLNDKIFSIGESIESERSKIGSTCASLSPSDKNITNDYTVDNGQRSSFYDYGRIVLKKGRPKPKRKVRIVFENFEVDSSDTGDLYTSESFDNELYSNDIPIFEGIRNTDIIDLRPRVGDYSLTSTLSPFDFTSRNFSQSGQFVPNILVSDESVVINYQYYLGRIDKIFLDGSGNFHIVKGIPSENPQLPANLDGNLDVATITLPPYLFSLDSIQIKRAEHKRYTMKDISNLDTRITNLEYYTALSLLEKETEALTIQDAKGLDRFKSGFFVDNFKTHQIQDQSNPDFACSIDTYNAELRPSHFTNSLDLVLGTTALPGIGASAPSTRDLRYNNDLLDPNLRKTGDLVTLNYADLTYMQNIFASRVESVNPFLITTWIGSLSLYPSSDSWVDQTIIKTNEFDATGPDFIASVQTLGINEATGFGEIVWGSWVDTVTGRDTRTTDTTNLITTTQQLNATDDIQTTTTQTVRTTSEVELHKQTREGIASRSTPHIEKINVGNKVVNRTSITFMRSRNVEFTGTRLKPRTQVYPVLDNFGMSGYTVPKLLEISMTSGTFQVGETVVGSLVQSNPGNNVPLPAASPTFQFRVAYANHKSGPYDSPIAVYNLNPYNNNVTLPDEYSSTSSILNVDTTSLSATVEGTYFGYPVVGMQLIGQTSSAQATVSNIRLITDEVGSVIGALFIPNPAAPSNPQFATGVKVVKLTSLPTINFVSSLNSTAAEATFPASGVLEFTEENILSVRSNAIHQSIFQESTTSESILGSSSAVVSEITQDTILTNVRQLPAANCDARYVAYTTAINNGYSSYTEYARAVGDYEANLIYNTAVLLTRQGAPKECGATTSTSSGRRSTTTSFRDTTSTRSSRGGRSYNFDSSGRLISTASLGSTRTLYTSTSISGTGSRSYRSSSSNSRSSSSRSSGSGRSSGGGRSYNFDSRGNLISTANLGSTQTSFTSRCSSRRDPLAQSFFVNSAEGAFITAIECYFQVKDELLPVTMQIRTMRDGTPTTSVVPFSELDLMPSQVNISDDASVATKFTFSSPVYLKGNTEYAFVLLADTPNYGVWISRMGEEDITNSITNPNATRTIISQQPLLGSLFKSQNGSTWDASQFEDIKFTTYRAQFTTNTRANASFYNPELSLGNGGSIILGENPIETLSKRIIVGLGTTLSSSQESTLVQGVNISQVNNTTATGVIIDTYGAIGIGGSVTIINAGIGYTPSSGISTYTNVSLTTLSGKGSNASANITVNNGGITSCFITNGGTGYSVGDELGITTLGSSSLGRNARFSVGIISAVNAIELDFVQGEFTTGTASTLTFRNQSTGGITTVTGVTANTITEDTLYDGLHFNVRNRNHAMYSSSNIVTLRNIAPDMKSTTISADIDNTVTTNISIANTARFETFENVGVGTTNPGYAILGNEIISYTGVNGNQLTGIARNIDSSGSPLHVSGEYISKYELNGISLRRINKDHVLGDATVADARELDNFYVKVDTSLRGEDRSTNSGKPKLFFNSTKKVGGNEVFSTRNIQFETITPNFQTMILPGTSLDASIRTVSATSVDGVESPFLDLGYEPISLDRPNDLSTPKIIASRVNENTILTDLPGRKSFTFDLELFSENSFVSPVVDLDRTNIILTSNRLNSPVTDYTTDNRITITGQDPHAAAYVTKKIDLANPANSIKVLFSAYRHETADIRVLYKIFTNDSNIDSMPYELFPGYSNLDDLGNVIDRSNNSGLPNTLVTSSKPGEYKDYEFFVDDLPEFVSFSIKIVMSGTNQAQPPRIKDLRVIAVR
jgi:CBS domain-containing protein